MPVLSPRLAAIVEALPLAPGMRVVEIGAGTGAAACAVAEAVGAGGHVLAVDRSARAIARIERAGEALIAAGRLSTRQAAAEDLVLDPAEERYDLVFAVRVGAFDGRHPDAGEQALRRLAHVLRPGGQLHVDGGDPLRVVPVPTGG